MRAEYRATLYNYLLNKLCKLSQNLGELAEHCRQFTWTVQCKERIKERQYVMNLILSEAVIRFAKRQNASWNTERRARGLLLLVQEQIHTMKVSVLPASFWTHFGECPYCYRDTIHSSNSSCHLIWSRQHSLGYCYHNLGKLLLLLFFKGCLQHCWFAHALSLCHLLTLLKKSVVYSDGY